MFINDTNNLNLLSTQMNLAGISTVMNVGVNHITFDIQGLPNGLSYQCNNSNCEYSSGSDGCIKLSGNPTFWRDTNFLLM